jgi:rRNA maturation endonuclease Nob1
VNTFTGLPYYVNPTFTTSNSNGNITFTSSNTLYLNNTIETGRVEKGDKSNQQFTNSYQNFEYNVSHQISLKILPLDNKNKTTDDIKHYCTECGSKAKKSHKFCPSCGNKL